MEENNPTLGLEDGTIGGNLPVPMQGTEDYENPSISYGADTSTVTATDPNAITYPPGDNSTKPGLSLERAKAAAAKAHFALGEKSPGIEILTNIYANGTDQDLRARLAREEDASQVALRNQIIRERAARGQAIDPEEISLLAGLAKHVPQTNPETFIEKSYANQLVNSAQYLVGGNKSPISEAYKKDPKRVSEVQDITANIVARQEILKRVLTEVTEEYSKQGWVGFLVDQAKSFIPFYGTAKIGWGENRSNSWLKGNIVDDMVNHFWRMPVENLAKELRLYLFDIAKDNPSLAKEMAEAMLSHTTSDQFWGNFATSLDAASVAPVRTTGKLVGKALEGAQALAGRGVAREAVPAASGAPRAAESIKAGVPKAEIDPTKDAFNGVNIVEGPTGKVRADGSPVHAFYRQETNSIHIDRDAVLKQWGEKPWESPKVPGVKPLDSSEFPTPESWYNFVIEHEKAHTRIRNVNNLSKAEYENLINEEALRKIKTGYEREQFSQNGSVLRKSDDVENAQLKGAWKDASDLIKSVDEGGVPGFISKNMRRIATELGVPISSKDTPRDVIEKLRGHVGSTGAPAGKTAVDDVEKAHQAIVRANASEKPDVSKMLNDMGDTVRASEVEAVNSAGQILKQSDPSGMFDALIRKISNVSNIFKPDDTAREAINRGGSQSLSGPRIAALTEHLQSNSAKLAQRIADLVKVGRAPDEAYTLAIRRESENFQNELLRRGAPEDAVLNISWVRPEDTSANIASVAIHMGRQDGSLFSTKFEAHQTASRLYKLDAPSYTIEQQGQGYYLRLTKTIDETDSAFRQSIMTSSNTVKESLWTTLFGFLRSADDRVPEHIRLNRKAVTHAHSALEQVIKEFNSNIGYLSKKDREGVFKVMKMDKLEGSNLAERGRFRETIQDFETAFHQANGYFPKENQVRAYFTYRELNDWDWMMRNAGVYRDRARQGIMTVVLKDDGGATGSKLITDQFNGKLLNKLPYAASEDASVLIHNRGQEPTRMRLKGIASNSEQAKQVEDLLKQGYRIVQVENPTRVPFKEKFGNDTVNFIITRDVEIGPLEYVQIPYRPGWHTEYPQEFYVKQAKIRQSGTDIVRHIYEGDTAVFGFSTQSEAVKYAKAMDRARIMLRDGSPDLENFLTKNLPFTKQKFESLFTKGLDDLGREVPAELDINVPFMHTYTGKYTIDDNANRTLFKNSFSNFEDTVRSQHNLFANTDKKFIGQRDAPLWTVKESGDELNPILKLADAEEIDPGLSLQRSMANIIRSRHFSDYKIAHVEGWVQQFGHLLTDHIDDVMSNPSYYIHKGSFVRSDATNRDALAAAIASRRAMLELLGTESELQTVNGSIRMRLMDSIYNTAGQEWSDWASRKFGFQSNNDPVKQIRNVAFQTGIGLFNPYQLLQNAMTMTNAIAIGGPVNGFRGAAAALPMRYVFHNEDTLEKFSKMSTSFGWKPAWFKESYNELKRTGKWIIEGEHTWKDDIAGPSLVQGKFSNFLDHGLIFFKEGERATRLASWNIAYLEWRTANPNAAMTDSVRRFLVDRSDLMAGNMTRASNAAWQQGIFSWPAQFLSYHARLAEQMLGKRLTGWEKARVITANSVMYGLPIGILGSSGLGAFTGGQYPLHEKVREEMLKRGISADSTVMNGLTNGLVGLTANLVGGAPTDAATKLGPGGSQLLKNIFDDEPFTKLLFGASGSKMGSIKESLDPISKYLINPFRSDNEHFPFRPEDAVGVLRNIKSVDNALAVYYAYNYGKLFAKNGQTIGDMTTRQAITQLLTGAGPQSVSDMYMKQDIIKNRSALVKKAMDYAARDGDAMFSALEKGDTDTAEMYRQRIAVHVKGADLRFDEQAKLFSEVYKKNRDRISTVNWQFLLSAPKSQVPDRFDNFTNRNPKN